MDGTCPRYAGRGLGIAFRGHSARYRSELVLGKTGQPRRICSAVVH